MGGPRGRAVGWGGAVVLRREEAEVSPTMERVGGFRSPRWGGGDRKRSPRRVGEQRTGPVTLLLWAPVALCVRWESKHPRLLLIRLCALSVLVT